MEVLNIDDIINRLKKNQKTNRTNSYEPFFFCGVRFDNVHDLKKCCDDKIKRGGLYFGYYFEGPLCFDEFDRAEAGGNATYRYFSAKSLEGITEIENSFALHRYIYPMLVAYRNFDYELKKDMIILESEDDYNS